MMGNLAVRLSNVAAELDRNRVMRVASVPHGHSELDRLEVKEGDRRDERLEGPSQARLDDELACPHGPAEHLSFAKSVSDSRGAHRALAISGYVGREAVGNLRPSPAAPETVDVR